MEQEIQAPKLRFLPQRPERNSNNVNQSSEVCELVSNHFYISEVKEKHNFVYSIDYEPELPQNSRKLGDEIIKSVESQITEICGEFSKRGRNIWANKASDQIQTFSTEVNEEKYIVRLKQTTVVDFSANTLKANQGVGNKVCMALNSKIKKQMRKIGLKEIGKNAKYFDPKNQSNEIKEFGLNVWRGYTTSVSITNDKMILLVDFVARVLRTQTALKFFQMQNDNQRAIESITGCSVLATYSNTMYRVDGVDMTKTPLSTFANSEGKETSFVDYYKQRYGVEIKDHQQPLFIHEDKKTKQSVLLIPELLVMTGITDEQKANYKVMNELAKFTKLNPQQRFKYIEDFVLKLADTIQTNQQITIETKSPKINGIIFDAPSLTLGRSKTIMPQGGNFNLRDTVYNPHHFKNWVLIYFKANNFADKEADQLVDNMESASKAFGVQFDNPGFVVVERDQKAANWIQCLKDDIQKNGDPEMVVCLIDSRDKKTHYKALKQFLNVEVGCPSQFVCKDTLKKNTLAVCSKILLQMTSKMGKVLWTIPKPKQFNEKLMVVGIDIYHKLVDGKQSCVGFVASIDPLMTQYYSKVLIQKQGQDTIDKLETAMYEALQSYYEKTGKKHFPEQIVIYRDGVGEGQLRQIELEINSLQKAFRKVHADYNPQFSHLIINKKINQRFFCRPGQGGKTDRGRGGSGSDMLNNPTSGTVVYDFCTTQPFQFYLTAQKVNQGTCTPTSYIVSYNDSDLTEEAFWHLTYNLCFNYSNWFGAVKVPAPVQYAHKLSYLVGDTYQKQANDKIADKLYYL